MAGKGGDEIRISTELLSDIQNRMKHVEAGVRAQQGAINSLLGHLDQESGADLRFNLNLRMELGGFSGSDIKSSLSACYRALDACERESVRISRAVGYTRTEFETTERELKASFEAMLAGNASAFENTGAVVARSSAGSAENTNRTGIDWNLDELLKAFICSQGILGETIEAFWGNGINPPDLMKFLIKGGEAAVKWKDMVKAFNKTKNFGLGYGIKTSLRKIFGLQRYTAKEGITLSKAASLITRKTRDFGKVFKKGVSNVASWAIELIDSGVENYNEYNAGYKDKGTAIAEWALEGAGAVLLTAAGTAAAAVLLPASAPALLVGAVGGMIVWGVDTIWMNTIGRGQDEDGGNEGIAEYIGESIVEGVKNAWNGLSDFLTNDSNVQTVWAY